MNKMIFILIALLTTACDETSTPTDPPSKLTIDGKGDISNGIERRGELEFAGEVSGEFDSDFEIHAYTISAQAGADFRVDVTNKGTSAALDTNMFLYKSSDNGLVQIAKDDDSGFAKHSRIDMTLSADAELVVVIKAEEDEGRGQYRIELTCNNGNCELAPQISDDCPEGIAESISACVFREAQSTVNAPNLQNLVGDCTNDQNAENYHLEQCSLGDKEYCVEDFQTFFIDQMIRNCEGDARETFAIDQPVALVVTQDINQRGELLNSCAECTLNINSYEYTGAPVHSELIQSAIAFTSWSVEMLVTDEEITDPRTQIATDLARRLQNPGTTLASEVNAHLDQIESQIGPLGHAGLLTGFDPNDADIFAWAINIPSVNKMAVYEIVER